MYMKKKKRKKRGGKRRKRTPKHTDSVRIPICSHNKHSEPARWYLASTTANQPGDTWCQPQWTSEVIPGICRQADHLCRWGVATVLWRQLSHHSACSWLRPDAEGQTTPEILQEEAGKGEMFRKTKTDLQALQCHCLISGDWLPRPQSFTIYTCMLCQADIGKKDEVPKQQQTHNK